VCVHLGFPHERRREGTNVEFVCPNGFRQIETETAQFQCCLEHLCDHRLYTKLLHVNKKLPISSSQSWGTCSICFFFWRLFWMHWALVCCFYTGVIFCFDSIGGLLGGWGSNIIEMVVLNSWRVKSWFHFFFLGPWFHRNKILHWQTAPNSMG
jgi:hypothetical protein